ncbi:hypothetical protein [Nocardioides stalactiti]|uniref:hypothetical protein n=1 Tax=Nocardioides stalactiti TaxID=2755356 RepID=UPI0015FF5B44|nr:hypothetical protein [Nocardioides stalactiti]
MTSSPLARWATAALVGIVLPFTAGVGLGSPAEAAVKKCGSLRSDGYVLAKKITAKNTTCATAKRKIRRYFLPGMDLDGFTCEGYPRQTCTKNRVVIAFTYP